MFGTEASASLILASLAAICCAIIVGVVFVGLFALLDGRDVIWEFSWHPLAMLFAAVDALVSACVWLREASLAHDSPRRYALSLHPSFVARAPAQSPVLSAGLPAWRGFRLASFTRAPLAQPRPSARRVRRMPAPGSGFIALRMRRPSLRPAPALLRQAA